MITEKTRWARARIGEVFVKIKSKRDRAIAMKDIWQEAEKREAEGYFGKKRR